MTYLSGVLDRCARSEMAKACVALINSAESRQDWLDGMAALDAKYPVVGFAKERDFLARAWSGEKVEVPAARQQSIFDDDTRQMIDEFNQGVADRKTAAAGGDGDDIPL